MFEEDKNKIDEQNINDTTQDTLQQAEVVLVLVWVGHKIILQNQYHMIQQQPLSVLHLLQQQFLVQQ